LVERDTEVFLGNFGDFDGVDENFCVEIGSRFFGSEVWIEPIPAIFDA